MIITHNNHLPDLIKFISKGSGEGGGIEIESMADTFKQLPDINWLTIIEPPMKKYIGFYLKYSAQFVPGFSVINSQIIMKWRNSSKSKSGPLIILLVSTRMTP